MADAVTRRDRNDRRVLVFQTTEEMAAFTADRFLRIAGKAIAERGYCPIALSGGKTPADLYARLGRLGEGVDWGRIHIFQVDERFVPHTDRRSNFRMIKETLLDTAAVPPKNVHPVPTGEADPWAAAEIYEAELVRFFRAERGVGGVSSGFPANGAPRREVPRFDLVTLGIGEDGHTASLFPDSLPKPDDGRLVRAVAPDDERVARITLALRVINRAANVIFFVRGAAKAEIGRRVIDDRDLSLPASLVEPEDGELLYLCDREAASLLSGGTCPACT